jgi:hypothetical protein
MHLSTFSRPSCALLIFSLLILQWISRRLILQAQKGERESNGRCMDLWE